MVRAWFQPAVAVMGWLAVLCAPVLVHVAIVTGRFAGLALAVAAGQAALLGVLAWRQKPGWVRRAGLAACGALLMVLAMRLFDRAMGGAGLLATSGVSHAFIHGSLLVLFAQSLRPGHTALVTGLARRLRGTLSRAMARYTRNVTIAWCGFFAGQLVMSALLLALAPYAAWSLYVNVLDGPLVLTMFAVEYAVRRLRFRNEPHGSPASLVRSVRRMADGFG